MTLLLAMQSVMLSGQLDTSGLWVNIDSLEITATKISKTWLRSTRAISAHHQSGPKLSPDLSLQDRLTSVPGVFTLNANNMAQDLRISIRGFGSRATFGVRGIKLIVDGIPETTPDGQGQLDAIPLGLLSNIEVIRGSAALLYGNASGGVISMKTISNSNANIFKEPLLTAKLVYGSFNTLQVQSTYATQLGNTTLLGHGNYAQSSGFRDNSGYSQAQFKLRGDHRFSKYSNLTASVDYLTSPQAQDPGGLNLLQTDSLRSQARPANVDFDSGEEVNQFKASAAYTYQVNKNNTFETYGFYINRTFDGRLPFGTSGVIDLDRQYYGQGASYTVVRKKRGQKQVVKWGYDVSNQFDFRKRFDVILGVPGSSLTTDQLESFKNVGVYILGDFDLGNLSINAGYRFDHNAIRVRDDLTLTGVRSGNEDFSSFNPSLGFNYELFQGASIFGSFSTAFETPTLLEISPSLVAGINNSIQPQRSRNFELGARMEIEKDLKAQLVIYQTNSNDELLPFEVDSIPLTLFENVGTTIRRGVELEIDYQIKPSLRSKVSYSYGRFDFDEHNDAALSGNRLPGIPLQTGYLSLEYDHASGFGVQLENRYVGDIFLDSENTVSEEAYFLGHLRLSYAYDGDGFSAVPFVNIRNLYNTEFSDNLRINAFGGRYYEPAPGLHFFVGISFKL